MKIPSISSIFNPQPSTPAAPAQPPASAAPAPTGEQGAQPVPGAEPTKEISPLDSFNDMWDIKAPEGDVPSSSLADVLTIDNQKIVDAVSKMDFSQAVTPEIMAKIQAGGEDATQAFLSAMNDMVKLSFGQSMAASASLVQKALATAEGRIDVRTQNTLRNTQIKDTTSTNSHLSHPAAAPMVSMITAQLAQKYPTASAQEIKQKAEEYFNTFASQLTGSEKVDDSSVSGGTDWEAYFKQ